MMRKAVKEGLARATSLALLEDRVALGKGELQIYGSQIGTDQEIILRVGSFVIQLALLFFIRNRLGRNLSYYKEKNVTISDYSLLIKDFPKVPNAQKKIKKVFEEFFYTPIKIEEIIMIGDLELYYKLKNEK